MASPTDAPPLPEARDVSPGRIVGLAMLLLALLAVALAVLWFVYGALGSGPAVGTARPDPAADLAAFNAEETRKLDTLGWVDRRAGLARIPVADAMAIIAGRGALPDWSAHTPLDAECALLESNVPRNPAAAGCAGGWQAFMRPK